MCLLAGESDTGESTRLHLVIMCQVPIKTCVYHANAKQSLPVFMQVYLFKIMYYNIACSLGRCQSSYQSLVVFPRGGGAVETARDVL